MRTFKDSKRLFMAFSMLLILFMLSNLQSCNWDKKHNESQIGKSHVNPVIEVITYHMDFVMPDTIPSGWNTFRYLNKSPQTHFFSIEKYPEGKTMKIIKKEVFPYFDSGMALLNEGKNDEAMAEFEKLPSYFSDVVILGGVGLLSPGETGETTMYLEPGHYYIECYVKMSNGMFHSSMGMFDEFNVAEKNSGIKPPKADYKISISSADGIVMNDRIKSGNHLFSVFFKDQIVHENFAGHDVNLVKINNETHVMGLEKWMNWVDPKGLIEPAPLNVTFLGGSNNMPTGSKAFFKADLKPGKYVLIAEVPYAISKNMLKLFEVMP